MKRDDFSYPVWIGNEDQFNKLNGLPQKIANSSQKTEATVAQSILLFSSTFK